MTFFKNEIFFFFTKKHYFFLNKDIGNTGNYREKTKPYLTPQLTLIGTRQFWRTYVLEKMPNISEHPRKIAQNEK